MTNHIVKALTATRKREWIDIFGTDKLPIQTAAKAKAHFPGFDRPQWCYMLDTSKLKPKQMGSLVLHLSNKFCYPLEWVMELLPTHGVPILTKGTAIHLDVK